MSREQRSYENKLIIALTDRLTGVGIDDSTYNFKIEDLVNFLNANLDFTGGSGDVNIRRIDYGSTPTSIVDSTNQRDPIIISSSDVLFFERTDPTRGLEVAVFVGTPGTYGNGATQLTDSDIIILRTNTISSDIDHDQTTNFVQSEHISPDGVSLVIEGGVLVVKQVNGHTVESDVPVDADFTNTQRPISDNPTLNDSSISASTVATNTLNTNIQNHISDTSNPHNVLATQITDFQAQVSLNTDVAANTIYRNVGHIPLSDRGATNGVAPLVNGLIPNEYFIEIVQSDWLQTDSNQTSFIQNKPSDVTNLSLHNTDELPEGLTNLYYTDTRVSQSTDVQANTVLRTMLDDVGNDTIVEKNAAGHFIGATKNTAYNLNFGTITGTVAQGDDSRFLTDIDKGLLTGGANTILHYHDSDRDRANHTGTQLASTISDFDTEVSNNVDVSANTVHRTSDGTDHTFINQDIRTTASPTFSQITLSNAATLNTHAVRYDQFINIIGNATWQNSVINIQSTPPVSPSTGDRYIVNPTGTGAWAGQDNAITEYNGTSWDFFTPDEGWATYVQDDAFNTNYIFNGVSWVEFGSVSNHNSLSGIQGGTANEYYHLTSAEYSTLHPAVSLTGESYLSLNAGTQALTANQIDLTSHVTGILPVANGGTGVNNFDPTNIARTNVDNNFSATNTFTGTNVGGIYNGLRVVNNSTNANSEASIRLAPSTSNTTRYAEISGINDGGNIIDLVFRPGLGGTIVERMRLSGLGNLNLTIGEYQLNGTSINTAGTLSNVAYLNKANIFTDKQIINASTSGGQFALDISNTGSGDGFRVITEDATANNGFIWRQGSTNIVNFFSDASNVATLDIGNINVANSYRVSGTTVIDASRNIVNAGSGSFSNNVTINGDIDLIGGQQVIKSDGINQIVINSNDVSIRYAGVEKFTTTSLGIDVAGSGTFSGSVQAFNTIIDASGADRRFRNLVNSRSLFIMGGSGSSGEGSYIRLFGKDFGGTDANGDISYNAVSGRRHLFSGDVDVTGSGTFSGNVFVDGIYENENAVDDVMRFRRINWDSGKEITLKKGGSTPHIRLTDESNNELFKVNSESSTELYYNKALRLTTTNAGIDVTGTVAATSFSGSGASLTSLNASNVSSGTLADARLSSNVALKNIDNNFPSTTFTDVVTIEDSDGLTPVLQITSASNLGTCEINFGDVASTNVGRLKYFHNGDYLQINAGGSETARFTTTGVVSTGTVTATNVFKKVTQTLSGTTPTMDCSTSVNSKITLTGNTTITLSNLSDGMSGNIRVTQDGTGGHTLTLSPTPKVINGGAGVITLTGTAGSTDIISWWYDGTNLNVNYGFNYS